MRRVNSCSAIFRCLQARFARRTDKISEQFLRQRIVGHTLGMPLHSNHPVQRRLHLNGFDNSVPAARRNFQFFARAVNRLVMTAVDFHFSRASQFSQMTARSEGRAMLQIFAGGRGDKVGLAVRLGAELFTGMSCTRVPP